MSTQGGRVTNTLRLSIAAMGLVLSLSTHVRAYAQDMKGMKMPPAQPAQAQSEQAAAQPSIELQELDVGDMVGTRPKPGGLAASPHGVPLMRDMDMSSMDGGRAPPDARSPDYSEGYRYGSLQGMRMADNDAFGALKLDELEYMDSRQGADGTFIEGEGWYGKDVNKLWLKAEGEGESGALQQLRTEALWNRAATPFWSTQLGVRYDSGEGPDRTWAALGVEGLAPYRFEADASVYFGQNSRSAARFELAYEALLTTQRLILQPRLEVNLYGKDDPQRGIGSGLSDAQFGLRLRYEVKREIAPYIGLVYRRRYGDTARFARAEGEQPNELQVVAGLRISFF
ncbi:MAG TPA: copper resistance protein B [Gammaproteobacteria bacterium]|nr:copper resistance protein B [Gammaproteobacteria bacterium]